MAQSELSRHVRSAGSDQRMGSAALSAEGSGPGATGVADRDPATARSPSAAADPKARSRYIRVARVKRRSTEKDTVTPHLSVRLEYPGRISQAF
jgi:hypothetical protein